MRKTDVKPGVVYAYRQDISNEIVPIVFLSHNPWIGTLRQVGKYGGKAFRYPHSMHGKPRPGTVYNDGTIGYPAVIGSAEASEQELATLRTFRLTDFDDATETVTEDGPELILVTSMARVISEWEG